MKQLIRILMLLLVACLLVPCLALAELPYALTGVPETTGDAQITIQFTGETGKFYTLHHKHRGVWKESMTTGLTGTEGAFAVELGVGKNDFVLREQGEPRDAAGGLAFTIERTAQSALPKATQAPVTAQPVATEKSTPKPTVTAAPTVKPTDKPTEAPTAVPTPVLTESPVITAEPTAEPTPAPAEEPEEAVPANRVMTLWARGNDVKSLQEQLIALHYQIGKADGVYGPRTVWAIERIQKKSSLEVDGAVGAETRAALEALGVVIEAYAAPDTTLPEGFDRVLSMGKEGLDVLLLQEALVKQGYMKGKADQVYGKRTRAAVMAFQREKGIEADGVAGGETLRALLGEVGAE